MSTLPQQTHERSHYDEALWQRATEYIAEKELSIADFAEQVKYSAATMSKYLSRDYVNAVLVEAALERFFRQQERTNTGVKYVPTAVSQAVIEACEYAYSEGKLVVLYGPPAIGKSVGAMEFMNRKIKNGIRNLVFVTANSTTTPFSLVRRVSEELGLPLTGCTPELLERIVRKLKKHPHLVVVDDASYLNVKALEALRYVYDQTACGVVLMGVKALMERIFIPGNGRMAEDLAQLYSRVNLQKYLPGAARAQDLGRIAEASKLPAKIIAAVLAEVKTPRELKNVLERVKYVRELNPDRSAQEIVGQALSEVFRAA
jgi:DNA transposition AAA+ family ATPase